jgi:hypothetical protein
MAVPAAAAAAAAAATSAATSAARPRAMADIRRTGRSPSFVSFHLTMTGQLCHWVDGMGLAAAAWAGFWLQGERGKKVERGSQPARQPVMICNFFWPACLETHNSYWRKLSKRRGGGGREYKEAVFSYITHSAVVAALYFIPVLSHCMYSEIYIVVIEA